ncbi:hypothetical protein HU200_005641 [Digitaria exilis]|uniref:Alpha/beta hydrolase fold-3 domain-containing protein n=1 Tax=Digitaria exilis TaxID=1010633 RepID=A0A835FSS7_9POAL|nr:hypothetical protein HU200_005641 [Digitaria exilis]
MTTGPLDLAVRGRFCLLPSLVTKSTLTGSQQSSITGYMASSDAAADEVTVELLPFIRVYKSGRIERLLVRDTVPASLHDTSSTGGVASKDVIIDPTTNVSVRLYLPPTAGSGDNKKLPVVVYFHGGGFMVESSASVSYHRYLNALAARAGALAVSVDYRRVPEHRLPAAYDDSWAALVWAVAAACVSSAPGGSAPEPWLAQHGDPSRVFLAGDSAGANIAHNVAMRAAAEGHPAAIRGVMLMHPYFWDASNTMGPKLEERIRNEWRFMTGNPDARVDDPRLSPTSAAAPSLAMMPTARVLVAVAGDDFLASKGRAYHAALLASGWRGEAELEDTPGEVHVFHLQRPGTEAAEKLMDRVVDFIASGRLGKKPTHYHTTHENGPGRRTWIGVVSDSIFPDESSTRIPLLYSCAAQRNAPIYIYRSINPVNTSIHRAAAGMDTEASSTPAAAFSLGKRKRAARADGYPTLPAAFFLGLRKRSFEELGGRAEFVAGKDGAYSSVEMPEDARTTAVYVRAMILSAAELRALGVEPRRPLLSALSMHDASLDKQQQHGEEAEHLDAKHEEDVDAEGEDDPDAAWGQRIEAWDDESKLGGDKSELGPGGAEANRSLGLLRKLRPALAAATRWSVCVPELGHGGARCGGGGGKAAMESMLRCWPPCVRRSTPAPLPASPPPCCCGSGQGRGILRAIAPPPYLVGAIARGIGRGERATHLCVSFWLRRKMGRRFGLAVGGRNGAPKTLLRPIYFYLRTALDLMSRASSLSNEPPQAELSLSALISTRILQRTAASHGANPTQCLPTRAPFRGTAQTFPAACDPPSSLSHACTYRATWPMSHRATSPWRCLSLSPPLATADSRSASLLWLGGARGAGHGVEDAFLRQVPGQSLFPFLFSSSLLYLSTRHPLLEIAVREEAAAGKLRLVVDRAAATVQVNGSVMADVVALASQISAVATGNDGDDSVVLADSPPASGDDANVSTEKVQVSDIAAVAAEDGGAKVVVTSDAPGRDTNGAEADTVVFDFRPYVLVYKSGRVHRFHGTDTVPPGVDTLTGVASKDVATGGVSARLYLPPKRRRVGKAKKKKLPVLLYFHGGAFAIESPFSPLYHAFLNILVSKAGVVAVAVNYRLAPEHPLPAAYDDAWAALKWTVSNCLSSGPEPWLANHGDAARIFLAGDSAGGNIAHNLAMRAGAELRPLSGGESAIAGVVLMNPYFWGKEPVGSETREQWVRDGLEQTWALVCGGRFGIDDPRVNPLAASPGAWRAMAGERVLVTIAGRDNFRDRAAAYAEGLRKSGWRGEVETYVTEGEAHVHFVGNPRSEKAEREMDKVAEFIAGSSDSLPVSVVRPQSSLTTSSCICCTACGL